jgi:hypothetical protein
VPSLEFEMNLYLLEGPAHCVCSGPLLSVGDDEAPVEGGVVEAKKKCVSDFKSGMGA